MHACNDKNFRTILRSLPKVSVSVTQKYFYTTMATLLQQSITQDVLTEIEITTMKPGISPAFT